MKTTKRLEELLDAKDAEIRKLESELEKYTEAEERDRWEWTIHREVTNTNRLPVPRLEMRYLQDDPNSWFNYRCLYALIYKHTLGHLVAVPMGETWIGGSRNSPPIFGDRISLPFRDGVHICEDAASLKLPAFAICADRIEKLSIRDGHVHQEDYSKRNLSPSEPAGRAGSEENQ